MQKVYVFYQDVPDRWVKGDRAVRGFLRRWIGRTPTHLSGMRRVVRNFLTGLQRKGVEYQLNPPRWSVPRDTPVVSFGMGRMGVSGIRAGTPLIAAVGFPYPSEFPELCERFELRRFLQHSKWTLDLVRSAGIYDEKVFDLWHAGVDTEWWRPSSQARNAGKELLIYQKVHWDRDRWEEILFRPVEEHVRSKGYTVRRIEYGRYSPDEYRGVLQSVRAAIFLSPHESQGFAYQECLSCNVPVFAWNPGEWLDPIRFSYGLTNVPATSVPFFDKRCGEKFADFLDFKQGCDRFLDCAYRGLYNPRDFVIENLTIDASTSRMLEYLQDT